MFNDTDMLSDVMKDLTRLVVKGEVIPVISNAFRIEQIFREDEELFKMMNEVPQFYDEFRSFNQQLTKKWAASINYPMSDDHNLARVAQFLQVEKSNSFLRDNYLQFLIDRLLLLAEKREYYRTEEEYKNTVSGYRKLKSQIPLFSDVANQLGYPLFMEGLDDPLRLLARLPVKIYITTSHSTFLEQALEKEGKTPHTHLCLCRLDSITDPKDRPDRDFVPSEIEPAVVHLFGLEDYAKTLVLSEDDYIDFLMNAVEHVKSDSIYPSYLRIALSDPEKSMLLLGYHLRDWEFRSLFRFLSDVRKIEDLDAISIAIQFKPSLGRKNDEAKALKYMEKYFKKGKFSVLWHGTDEFIYRLYEECRPLLQDQL